MKNSSRKPKIDDVATEAGVSTATVSRCLNAPDRVSEQTRVKVRNVIQKLGYAPNFGAQALASNRTNAVGAVIPTMDNAIFARGLQAFQEVLANSGVTLLVASSDYRPGKEFEQICALSGRGVDGFLLIGRERPESTVEFLNERDIPHVLAWNTAADGQSSFAGFDNRAAAGMMARLVLEWGHRRMAIISARREGNDRAADRVEGMLSVLETAGTVDGPQIVECSYTLDAGAAAFERLMRISPRPTAILCGNDVLAAGALGEARRLNMGVPEDVSIVGFDDIDLSRATAPQITTVHVPHRRMGRAAAEMLLAMRKGRRNPESVTFETKIVLRETLGPAPR